MSVIAKLTKYRFALPMTGTSIHSAGSRARLASAAGDGANALRKSLLYEEFGEPVRVLRLCDASAKKPGGDEVLVKWLLAPVNPADINTVQGKYPTKPRLPAIPGNEGVGEVLEAGSLASDLLPGDRVVPNGNNLGTWTSRATYPRDRLLKVPRNIGTVEACMLNVNPCTAFRLLTDFVKLNPGDWVIQNGGNSAVGQFVIQLCRIWKLKSVSVVRDRPDIAELKTRLERLGGTRVLTEEELAKTDLFKREQIPRPLLGLNCVGGRNALDVLRQIGNGGTMVTYGGMSREPVTVPTSAFIFKDIRLRGFWMTDWTRMNEKSPQRSDMLDHLGKLFKSNELRVPAYKIVPLSNYHEAIENTLRLDGKLGVKYIFDLCS